MELMVGDAGALVRVDVDDVEALGPEQCRQVLEAVLAHLQRHPWAVGAPPREWSFWLAADGRPDMGGSAGGGGVPRTRANLRWRRVRWIDRFPRPRRGGLA